MSREHVSELGGHIAGEQVAAELTVEDRPTHIVARSGEKSPDRMRFEAGASFQVADDKPENCPHSRRSGCRRGEQRCRLLEPSVWLARLRGGVEFDEVTISYELVVGTPASP